MSLGNIIGPYIMGLAVALVAACILSAEWKPAKNTVARFGLFGAAAAWPITLAALIVVALLAAGASVPRVYQGIRKAIEAEAAKVAEGEK